MQVVDIDVDAIIDDSAHKGVALGSQTVIFRRIAASGPLDAVEVDPIEVSQGVEPGAERHPAGSGRAVRVRVGRVDVSMVVEVLFPRFSSRSCFACFQSLVCSDLLFRRKGVKNHRGRVQTQGF